MKSMPSNLQRARLCSACQSLTFAQFRDGYTHPLNYPRMVESGKSCLLYKLIVCSMAKLQTTYNCYEFEAKYDSKAGKITQKQAVSRQRALEEDYQVLELLKIPQEVSWGRSKYMWYPNSDRKISSGNFNQGETIEITAPESNNTISSTS